MITHSKLFCIIPARGGSKRIPRKNIKPFLGKPLIAYSIECAKAIGAEVIVSTDCQEIAGIARTYGGMTPFLRDKALSDDFTPTLEVIYDAILKVDIPKDSTLITLYPTAPLLSSVTLKNALHSLTPNSSYVFSATSFDFTPFRSFTYENNELKMLYPEHQNTRSQDLPTLYHDAGQFYIASTQSFLQKLPIFSPQSTPYILSPLCVQDIDTPEDFALAELKYRMLYEG